MSVKEQATPKEQTPDLELYGKLRNKIVEGRDNLKKQAVQLKEVLEAKEQELEQLKIQAQKLAGAIEVSDLYLKEALPTNNPKA